MAQVKIKVRPKQTVQFPGICVHCAQPAAETLLVRKRVSRTTRLIDVPVCSDCAKQLQRKSMEEERFGQLKYVISALALLVTLFALYLVLPPSLPAVLRWLLALSGSLLITAVLYNFIQHKIKETYVPEKKAVLNAARIETFSWRATTFTFENDTFSQRFVELNEPSLMEI